MEYTPLRTISMHIGLFLLFYLEYVLAADKAAQVRLDDKPFPTGRKIHNRTLTCSEQFEPGKFAAQTWTCKDMRVDGLRLAYGYNPSITKSHLCVETKGFNELAELCRRMMQEIGSEKKLWAAFVTNANCDYISEERFLLNMTGPGRFGWSKMKSGYGWIDTLHCMAVK